MIMKDARWQHCTRKVHKAGNLTDIKTKMEVPKRVQDIMNQVAQISAYRGKLEQDEAAILEEL
jgi:DNA-binding FrmR family transcriptional regulator